jgi:hypothetical protein
MPPQDSTNLPPVIGKMSPTHVASKLRELGDTEEALEVEAALERSIASPAQFGFLDGLLKPKPWRYTAHAIGFLRVVGPSSESVEIRHAGNIPADETLKNSRLRITLNRLHVAAYPGGGMHRILFDFYAQNQVPNVTEELHFNSTFRVQEGQQVAVVGYPIFVGLNVGSEGVAFRCYTVNVKNDADEAFLNILESDVAQNGLKLATIAQPALGPFVKVALGLTKTIAQRNRNVPVQDFYLGLDFGGTTMGARLAQGDFIVQIPERLQVIWDWSEWVYNPNNGHIVNKTRPTELIPYNYLVFGVSRYEGS